MCTILELWDIHGHNAIKSLTKNHFKKILYFWTSAAQLPNSFICILDIIFKLKE